MPLSEAPLLGPLLRQMADFLLTRMTWAFAENPGRCSFSHHDLSRFARDVDSDPRPGVHGCVLRGRIGVLAGLSDGRFFLPCAST
jgi:hypothetical protein